MAQTDRVRPRYARIWRGIAPREKADAYEQYWLANGIDGLKRRGALDVHMLREDRADETEFVTVSFWESLDAMADGESGDPTATHHLARDHEFLIALPDKVQVLRVLQATV